MLSASTAALILQAQHPSLTQPGAYDTLSCFVLQAATATPAMLNACMVMLQSAAAKGAALAHEGHDMAAFEAQISYHVAALHVAAAQRELAAGRVFELPPDCSPLCSTGSWKLPQGKLPAPIQPSAVGMSLEQRRTRAATNLGSLPVLLPAGSAFAQALLLLKQSIFTKPANDVAALHQLRSIERELFRRAAEGFSNVLQLVEVRALQQLVSLYRDACDSFLASKAGSAVMRTEQRSREMLVVWVAFCLTHAATCAQHPLLRVYGISLQWGDLRHLVLSNRAAVDAALSVSTYLHTRTKAGKEVFSLGGSGPQATFSFAQQFAQADSDLRALWASEQQDAERRKTAHWAEVQRKQALVAKLRAEIRDVESQLQSAQLLLRSAEQIRDVTTQYEYSGHCLSTTSAYRAADRTVSTRSSTVSILESAKSQLDSQLDEALKPPPSVIQPLPHDEPAALQWLFFLHMPPLFRHLSRASFLAQQMLLPRPLGDAASAIGVQPFATSLTLHYNQHQQCRPYHTPPQQRSGSDGEPGNVHLVSMGKVPGKVRILLPDCIHALACLLIARQPYPIVACLSCLYATACLLASQSAHRCLPACPFCDKPQVPAFLYLITCLCVTVFLV